MSILLLTEILDGRARKEKELAFYTREKERLEIKLAAIRCELSLTDKILMLIRAEKLIEVKNR